MRRRPHVTLLRGVVDKLSLNVTFCVALPAFSLLVVSCSDYVGWPCRQSRPDSVNFVPIKDKYYLTQESNGSIVYRMSTRDGFVYVPSAPESRLGVIVTDTDGVPIHSHDYRILPSDDNRNVSNNLKKLHGDTSSNLKIMYYYSDNELTIQVLDQIIVFDMIEDTVLVSAIYYPYNSCPVGEGDTYVADSVTISRITINS